MSDESKPTSLAEDDDDTVSTASEFSLDECLENSAIQSVIIKPVLACPGVVSKIESTIRHVHVSTVPDNDSPTSSSPTITQSSNDKNYSIALL